MRGKETKHRISSSPLVQQSFDFNDADSDGSFNEDVSSRPAQDINTHGVTQSGKSYCPDQVGTTWSGKSSCSAEASYVFINSYLGYLIGLADQMDVKNAFWIKSDLDSKSDSMTR